MADGPLDIALRVVVAALLLNFGDSALEFMLRAWIGDFDRGYGVRSELAVAVQVGKPPPERYRSVTVAGSRRNRECDRCRESLETGPPPPARAPIPGASCIPTKDRAFFNRADPSLQVPWFGSFGTLAAKALAKGLAVRPWAKMLSVTVQTTVATRVPEPVTF